MKRFNICLPEDLVAKIDAKSSISRSRYIRDAITMRIEIEEYIIREGESVTGLSRAINWYKLAEAARKNLHEAMRRPPRGSKK